MQLSLCGVFGTKESTTVYIATSADDPSTSSRIALRRFEEICRRRSQIFDVAIKDDVDELRRDENLIKENKFGKQLDWDF